MAKALSEAFKGIPKSPETVQNMIKSHMKHATRVYEFNPENNEFVKLWYGYKRIYKETGIYTSIIKNATKGKSDVDGRIFRTAQDVDLSGYLPRNLRPYSRSEHLTGDDRKIVQFNENGRVISVFDKAADAVRYIMVHSMSNSTFETIAVGISGAIRTGTFYYGYGWCRKTDIGTIAELTKKHISKVISKNKKQLSKIRSAQRRSKADVDRGIRDMILRNRRKTRIGFARTVFVVDLTTGLHYKFDSRKCAITWTGLNEMLVDRCLNNQVTHTYLCTFSYDGYKEYDLRTGWMNL